MVVWVLSDDSWGDTGRWQVSTWPLPWWPPPWCPALRGPGPLLPTGTHRHNAAARVSCPQDKDPPQSSQQEAPSASLTGEETRPLKCQGPWGSGRDPQPGLSAPPQGRRAGCTHSAFPRRAACLLAPQKEIFTGSPRDTLTGHWALGQRRGRGSLGCKIRAHTTAPEGCLEAPCWENGTLTPGSRSRAHPCPAWAPWLWVS